MNSVMATATTMINDSLLVMSAASASIDDEVLELK